MKKLITILVALVVNANSFGQVPNCLWAKSSGGTDYDHGRYVSTDLNGNIYVTGGFESRFITFGTTTFTNSGYPFNLGYSDIFIVKYDPEGTILWAKSAGGASYEDVGTSISNDSFGNVYVTGFFESPTITFGSIILSNTNSLGFSSDVFFVKYDPNGNVLWAKSLGGTSNDINSFVSAVSDNNVYLSGSFASPSITIGTTTLTNAGGYDIFLIKYSSDGNILYATKGGGTGNDYVQNISEDTLGNFYVTGNFYSPIITFGTDTLTNIDVSGNINKIFLAKYDNSGNVLWAKSAGGDFYDVGNSISTDLNGNLYLTGSFSGATLIFGTDTLTNLSNVGGSDVFIVKYATDGSILWTRSIGGNSNDVGSNVTTDEQGNLFLTGYFQSSTINFESYSLTNSGFSDIFISKYSPNGDIVWATSAICSYFDYVRYAVTDVSGNLFITGYFDGSSITFGTNTLYNEGEWDFFLVKYGEILTGLNESLTNNQLIISPNPTNSTITLTMPTLKNSKVSITTLTGTEVGNYNTQNTSTQTIDISHLANGVYFVSLKSEEGGVTKKIIKQ
jgi:hypothetical protein